MKKLIDLEGENLQYIRDIAKKEKIAEKKAIEDCISYARKKVIKIETTCEGYHGLQKM